MFQVTIILYIVLGTVVTEPVKVEPEMFTVKFLLYTPQHKVTTEGIFIKAPNADISTESDNSNFNGSACTKFIIHGYMSYYPEVDWLIKMRDQFLEFPKCNVIVVDWSQGNKGPYAQASANTRTAANATADFINYLKKVKGLSLKNVHILGCSLGAHTAGFVGKALGGEIGRITGLDPASPGFTDPQVDRLNNTYAEFVDVIHSDVYEKDSKGLQAGFGISINVGHIDFWVNNGVAAPDCILPCMKNLFPKTPDITNTKKLEDCMSCSHAMAAYYYVDSINPANPNGTAHQNEPSNDESVRNAPEYAIIGEKAVLSAPYKNITEGKPYYLTAKPNSPYFETKN